jgi:hypothetical protein
VVLLKVCQHVLLVCCLLLQSQLRAGAAAASAAAGRYTYFVGVMDVLVHQLGCVGAGTLLSGASCGALIAVFTKCGLPVETVLDLTRKFSHVSVKFIVELLASV